jgi:hypothetical protein
MEERPMEAYDYPVVQNDLGKGPLQHLHMGSNGQLQNR